MTGAPVQPGMPRRIAVTVALVCGLAAFAWTLLASLPPTQAPGPQTAARRPRPPDHPDRLLDWLAEGNGDDDFVAWRNAGEIRLWRGDVESARDAWRRAALIAAGQGDDEMSLNEQFTYAWCLARLADPQAPAAVERALGQLDALEADRLQRYQPPVYRALLLRLLGDEAGAAQQIALARDRFKAAGELETADNLYWRARIEAAGGNLDAALATLERIAESGQIVERIGRARWSFEFGALRDEERFQQAIRRIARNSRLRQG